jgi:hypothetical protein
LFLGLVGCQSEEYVYWLKKSEEYVSVHPMLIIFATKISFLGSTVVGITGFFSNPSGTTPHANT